MDHLINNYDFQIYHNGRCKCNWTQTPLLPVRHLNTHLLITTRKLNQNRPLISNVSYQKKKNSKKTTLSLFLIGSQLLSVRVLQRWYEPSHNTNTPSCIRSLADLALLWKTNHIRRTVVLCLLLLTTDDAIKCPKLCSETTRYTLLFHLKFWILFTYDIICYQ